MKVLSILLSFVTSFSYAFYASFLYKLDDNEKEWFLSFDLCATLFFVLEFIFNLMVKEHDTTLHG